MELYFWIYLVESIYLQVILFLCLWKDGDKEDSSFCILAPENLDGVANADLNKMKNSHSTEPAKWLLRTSKYKGSSW